MQLSFRTPLIVGAAVAVVAGSIVPGASTPARFNVGDVGVVDDVAVQLADVQKGEFLAVVIRTIGDLFDAAHSYTYIPNGSGPSVSHPVGLIPELLQDAKNPPILTAITSNLTQRHIIDISLVSDFLGYANAARAVVGQQVGKAVHDTFTPSEWGGGKVLNDWSDTALVKEAMTLGVGAEVNGKWVPSLRVAAFSTRNQIADDILGTQTYSNYVQRFKVVLLGEVVPAGAASTHMAASTGSPRPAASRRANPAATTARTRSER